MEVQNTLERTLSQLDQARLRKLATQAAQGGDADNPLLDAMEELLDVSEVVESRDMPRDIVTMNSQVLLADTASGERYNLTLCYPQDAEPAAGFVSVMSPVGSSLLGARVGSTVRWTTPAGVAGAARIEALLYQPEASGDFLS